MKNVSFIGYEVAFKPNAFSRLSVATLNSLYEAKKMAKRLVKQYQDVTLTKVIYYDGSAFPKITELKI